MDSAIPLNPAIPGKPNASLVYKVVILDEEPSYSNLNSFQNDSEICDSRSSRGLLLCIRSSCEYLKIYF
jgi:hypothetical protein